MASAPAAQALRERVEKGESLSLHEVSPAAQPFLAALLAFLFPSRPIVVVTESLKTQEVFQQDLQTWTSQLSGGKPPLFYPAWEILPHEARLPHLDVISERLETLVALTEKPAPQGSLVVTNVTALLGGTLPPAELERRTRRLRKGARTEPLDLIEWLEQQGYEPEAQVAQQGISRCAAVFLTCGR